MKRGLALLAMMSAVAYFGYVRETDARGLRCRQRAAACRSTCIRVCSQTVAPPTAAPPTAPPPAAPPETKPEPKPAKIPPAPPSPLPAKLHALLLIDAENAGAGRANQASGTLFEKLLRSGVPAERVGQITKLSGKSLDLETVRDTLALMPIESGDTLVAYYAGPVSVEGDAVVLTPTAGEKFARSDLRSVLLLQKARLTVLLTDPISHAVSVPDAPKLTDAAGPWSLGGLFFDYAGIVDWNAAGANQNAFARDAEGGFFTLALEQAAGRVPDSDRGEAWSKLFADTASTTERLYKAYRQAVLESDSIPAAEKRPYREQRTQTPTALATLDEVGPATPVRPTDGGSAETLPLPAEIVVKVPAGAELTIDGEPTRQTRAVRHFETPPLEPGRVYRYYFQVQLAEATENRIVTVRAGETVIVEFATVMVVENH